MSNLDNLLDMNLDDIADLPEFLVPPAGAYRALIKGVEQKTLGTHPAIEFTFKLLETQELIDPNDTPVADGSETSLAYMTDNEFGVGNMKKLLVPIAAAAGTTSVRDTIEAAKGMEVFLVTKIRKDKNDATKKYFDIAACEVL